MGIRVTKVLGYGLTDVKIRKYNIADGRINTKSPLLDYSSKKTLDDYIDWLNTKQQQDQEKFYFNMDGYLFKEREEEGFKWNDRTGAFSPQDLCHHGIEYMMKNVLLIRPLSCKDWNRHDDIMDYIEETSFKDVGDTDYSANWVKEIPGGIFPYSGSFMDARTGERVKDGITLYRYLTWPSYSSYLRDEACQEYGFNDIADAYKNLVPIVPDEVRDLCEWGKLFIDDDVWKQLRPLLYCYWS